MATPSVIGWICAIFTGMAYLNSPGKDLSTCALSWKKETEYKGWGETCWSQV